MSTFNSRSDAQKAGDRVWPTLKGKGWKIRVWENMGWHVAWDNGALSVYPASAYSLMGGFTEFHCLLSEEDKKNTTGGLAMWTPVQSRHKDPNEAVRVQMDHAREVVNKLVATLDSVEERLKGKKRGKRTR